MTEEQRKKIQNRVTALTFGVIGLLAVFLVVLAVTKTINTVLFPIGAGVLLVIYWVIADVLAAVWLHLLDDRTEAQKKAYYYYAAADAVGLAGLVYFVANMTSTVGVILYVVSIFLKRRFRDEYLGKNDEAEEPEEEPGEFPEQLPGGSEPAAGDAVEEAAGEEPEGLPESSEPAAEDAVEEAAGEESGRFSENDELAVGNDGESVAGDDDADKDNDMDKDDA